MPAAHIEQLPGDPARLFGGEENDHVGDVVRLADAPQRHEARFLFFECGRNPARLNGTQRDDVHRDAALAQFCGRGAAVGFQRVLARAVGHRPAERRRAVGAHVDDPPPARAAFDVTAGEFGHHQRDSAAVDGEMLVMLICRDGAHRKFVYGAAV